MPILIVAATSKELREFLPSQCHDIPSDGQLRGVGFGSHALALGVCGVGPVAAALRLGRFLEAFPGIDGVLNVGIAGAFDVNRLPFGALTVVTKELLPEYARVGEGDPSPLDFAQAKLAHQDVFNAIDLDPQACAQAMGLALPAACVSVVSATVAGVSASADRAQAVRRQTQADIENMEGFSIALACLERGLPFVELRAVSNLVGGCDRAAHWDIKAAFAGLKRLGEELLA